jgi:hypothetical protein
MTFFYLALLYFIQGPTIAVWTSSDLVLSLSLRCSLVERERERLLNHFKLRVKKRMIQKEEKKSSRITSNIITFYLFTISLGTSFAMFIVYIICLLAFCNIQWSLPHQWGLEQCTLSFCLKIY